MFNEILNIAENFIYSCSYNYESKYRKELIIRYGKVVFIIRNLDTKRFASKEDYINALKEELLVKLFLFGIFYGIKFIKFLYENSNNKSANNSKTNKTYNPPKFKVHINEINENYDKSNIEIKMVA